MSPRRHRQSPAAAHATHHIEALGYLTKAIQGDLGTSYASAVKVPPVPRPLPDRSRSAGRAAIALLIATLIVAVLITLL